jgi:3-hydroxybutyryl-CoA dehydrogenase
MSFDAHSRTLTLAVAGSGAMGRGIAQIAAQAGLRVLLFDAKPGAAESARETLAHTFETLRQKGKLADGQARQAAGALRVAQTIEALSEAQLVVEAIVEDLEAKRRLFQGIEAVVSPATVLATNTSSLSVTAIAAGCQHPQRVAGYHFFNPVPLMKVVEVVAGLKTDPAVLASLAALAERMGHLPVQAQDTPGFIVNHAGRGYGTEALKVLGEGVGAVQHIDAVLRAQAGFRLGPFELLDLTGLDVSVPVMETIYHQYFQEPRYRPSPLAAQRHAAGLLGRKSGEGFYRYEEGKPILAPAAQAPTERPASVWISTDDAALGAAARELARGLGAKLDDTARPREESLCIVTPVGEDVTRCLTRQGLDGRRVVGLDMLFPQDKRRALFFSPLASPGAMAGAQGLFAADGTPVSLFRDSAGLIAQRVVCVIVNIACDMAQQGIATPRDIDKAVMLGLGYPLGPLAWGDRLGGARVLQVLSSLTALTGDARYRPSPWLRRRAELGLPLQAAEPKHPLHPPHLP